MGVVSTAFAVLFLVWFLNLFNFMDGIDGIAGAEAVSVMTLASGLMLWTGVDSALVFLSWAIAASVIGFLIWNWPPARIFLGDAGSGFLGFYIGAIAWQTITENRLSFWAWLILLGVFIVDATVTLVRRWARGARLADAHRSHAYQRLSRRFHSHLKITLGVICINVFWLGPFAFAATARPRLGSLLALIALAPLILIAWYQGAGLDAD